MCCTGRFPILTEAFFTSGATVATEGVAEVITTPVLLSVTGRCLKKGYGNELIGSRDGIVRSSVNRARLYDRVLMWCIIRYVKLLWSD